MKFHFEWKGEIAYERALRYQALLTQESFSGLIGFCPPPTITLGLGSDGTKEILVPREQLEERQIEVIATDRGGKATYHGPGQLVGFPMISLSRCYGDSRAVRRFSEDLLLGLAHACAAMGVKSVETRSGYPGVWTRKGKIASVGIAVKDGFVFHGFSLNIQQSCQQGFQLIQPCGIANCQITSLELEGIKQLEAHQVFSQIIPYLEGMFSTAGSPQEESNLRFDRTFDNVVQKVSRSPMALDYLATNICNSSLRSN